MALEKKHWIRLTRVCNENCVFCLDKEAQDGTDVAYEDILRRFDEGLAAGATRAIVSGGEPTIHPRFHEIVRSAREKGYQSVQVVTNGQMLCYPDFFQKALTAGLTEATFSIHGHTTALHDRQTRLPGSFRRAVKALVTALKSPLIVNVDIVLTRMNVRHLRAMLEFFGRLGVKEFDLLHLIPFSHGWTNFKALHYTPEEGAEAIREGLEYAEKAGLRVWTNRLPIQYMPGFEHYLQNAYKFHDEITGREGAFDRWANQGKPLPCYGDRCPHCFLDGFCKGLVRSREQWHLNGKGDIRLGDPVPPSEAVREAIDRSVGRTVTVTGSDSARARSLLDLVPEDRSLIVEIEQGPFEETLLTQLSRRREAVLRFASAEQFETLRPGFGLAFEVSATRDAFRWLRNGGADFIRDHPSLIRGLSLPTYMTHEEAASKGISLDSLLDSFPFDGRLRNIPPCISPEASYEFSLPLDARILTPDRTIDTHAYADSFIRDGYFVKGAVCEGCPFSPRCLGFHANYIKAFGWPRRSRLNRAGMAAECASPSPSSPVETVQAAL